MNIGNKIPEVLGIDQDGIVEKIFTPKEIKAYNNDMYKLMVDTKFV